MMKRRGMGRSLDKHVSKQIRLIERRLFLRQGLSLGALALLSGCQLTEDEGVQVVLSKMSRWNDGVQAWLFDPDRLAPEYPAGAITPPFPFNAFYGEAEGREGDAGDYSPARSGESHDRTPWALP